MSDFIFYFLILLSYFLHGCVWFKVGYSKALKDNCDHNILSKKDADDFIKQMQRNY